MKQPTASFLPRSSRLRIFWLRKSRGSSSPFDAESSSSSFSSSSSLFESPLTEPLTGVLEPQTLDRVQPVHLGVRPVRAPVRGCLVERHAPAADGDVVLHLGSKLLDLALRSPAPDAQATRPRLPRHRLARRRGGVDGRRGRALARGLHLGGRRDFGRPSSTSSRNLRNFLSSSSAVGGTRTTTTVASSCNPRSVPSAASMIRSAASLDARRGFTHDVSAHPPRRCSRFRQTPTTNTHPSAGALNRFTPACTRRGARRNRRWRATPRTRPGTTASGRPLCPRVASVPASRPRRSAASPRGDRPGSGTA